MILEIWRCEQCHRILSETNHPPGLVTRVKCPHCNAWNSLRVPPERTGGFGPTGYEKRAVG